MMNRISLLFKRAGLTASVLAFTILPAIAGQAAHEDQEIMPDMLLWVMLGMAVILGFVVIGLLLLLKTSLELKHKSKSVKPGSSVAPRLIPLLLFSAAMAAGNTSFAQTVEKPLQTVGGMHPWLFYFFATVIVLLLSMIALLYRGIMMVLKPKAEKTVVPKAGILERLNASVPIEQEKDVMLDHDYDGIRELDNNLPPWWKYGFYLTIVISCIYMWRYHVSGTGMLQQAEYEEQLSTAEKDIAAYKKKAGDLVDENTVTLLTDATALSNGKNLYTANCGACHGQLGEGGVGPNLTDAYWLHGGSVKDVFKTIKYGWPQKGMKSWEKDFGARQMQELSSYIASLQGSNPPNGKEKQGALYEEVPATLVDSNATAVK